MSPQLYLKRGIMASRTRWWLSFPFLDLRFVISRATEESTQEDWLRPRWLYSRDNFPQVGKIGRAVPIPGIDRMVADYNHHAAVDGFLLLQTPAEAIDRALTNEAHAGFVFRQRELVADGQGHVRFDMIVEAVDDGRDSRDLVAALLDASMVAPLGNGDEIALIDAASVIARVYETESAKTSIGFAEDRKAAFAAASGTVVATAPPLIVKIDPKDQPLADTQWHTLCDMPCSGTLSALLPAGSVAGATCWRFAPTPDAASDAIDEQAAANALYGLGWLVGQFYETALFRERIAEYQHRTGVVVLPDRVRDAIRQRNRRLGHQRVGGWQPIKLVSGAVAIAKARETSSDLSDQLAAITANIAPFATDKRDLGGITNNIVQIITNIREFDMTTIGNITNSNVNIGSILSNVTQSIGAMPNVDDGDREELIKQVDALRAELDKLDKSDPATAEAAEALSEKTREAVEIAAKPQPNKTLLRSAINTAKEIATGIGDIATPVLAAITTIGAIIAKIHAL